MSEETSLASLRARVSALVDQEAALLAQAFELSRNGDPRGVDALFAQVQAIQLERTVLKTQLGNVLGTHRMHTASEVWKAGLYDYRREAGGSSVRVRVVAGPLGLQVHVPGQAHPLPVETVEGTFDGPFAADDFAGEPEARREASADPPGAARRRRSSTAAPRSSRKKPQ